jgi:5-methylcytosine-specific restriction endonuclease McrA
LRSQAKREGPYPKVCATCGIDFLGTKSRQRFCTPECRYITLLKEANEKYQAFREANPIPDFFEYTCNFCQQTFIKPHRVTGSAAMRGLYCENCRVPAQRARYRVKTVKRQSQTVKPSGAWFEEVLNSHGSICYLCNNEIDITLPRRSKHGPTVDHVIPLSRGGSDELDNLRLTHWECNMKKSNKLIGELNG